MSLDILRYRKLSNGMWQVYDRDGRTAEGITKDDAKRLYFIYYKMPYESVNGYTRHGLIPSDKLKLEKN